MNTKFVYTAVVVAPLILAAAGWRSIAAPGRLAQSPASSAAGKEKKVMVKKLTPVLFVKEIEPVLPFWVEGLGFTKTAEVPEGNKLGFVILEKDGVEVMYQSYASVDKDMPAIGADVRKGPTFLYLQVDNLEELKAAVKRAEVYMPERKTFYGSTEIGVKDPAGHFITFAQFAAAPQK
ncbi:MAG: VOC family protein [Candidatus Acidiferrales bacterium]